MTRFANPFEVTIYDKSLARRGFLNDFVSISVTPRHNAVGVASLVVAADHKRLPILKMPGARLGIRFRSPLDADQTTREHLMSGYVTNGNAQGPQATGTVTVSIEDDLGLLDRMLGWPVPSDTTLTAQGVKQDSRTGPAETVAKAFVSAQMAHNIIDPITVAATHGWGTSITAACRMSTLGDTLFSLVDKAGVGLSAKQVNNASGTQGTSIQLDAYQPKVYPYKLSESARTVTNWTYSWADGVTRVIIGGPTTDGQPTSRQFKQIVDPREADWGYTREAFVDASSAESSSGVTLTQAITKVGTDYLAENAPKFGFTVEMSENKTFHYGGNGVHVGDKVTVNVMGSTFTDVLREATLTFDADTGLVVTPTIGEHSDDPDVVLGKFVTDIARTQNRQAASG